VVSNVTEYLSVPIVEKYSNIPSEKLFKSKVFQKPFGTLDYSSPVYGEKLDYQRIGKDVSFPRVHEEIERIDFTPERLTETFIGKRVTPKEFKKFSTTKILAKIIGGLRKDIPLNLLSKYGLAVPELLTKYYVSESSSSSSSSSTSSESSGEEDIEHSYLYREGAELPITTHVQILCKKLHFTPETLSKLCFRLKMTPATLLFSITKVPVDVTFIEIILKKIAFLPFKFEMSPSILIMCLKKLAMIPEVVTMSGYNVFVS